MMTGTRDTGVEGTTADATSAAVVGRVCAADDDAFSQLGSHTL